MVNIQIKKAITRFCTSYSQAEHLAMHRLFRREREMARAWYDMGRIEATKPAELEEGDRTAHCYVRILCRHDTTDGGAVALAAWLAGRQTTGRVIPAPTAVARERPLPTTFPDPDRRGAEESNR